MDTMNAVGSTTGGLASILPAVATTFVVLAAGAVAVASFILWSAKANSSGQKKKEVGGKTKARGNTKEGFSMKKVPEDIDVVVIGAGVSGLTVASMMSKEGKRVLVLEQHDVAGGNTHTFVEKGYEFDTGLHYVGNRIGEKGIPAKQIFDYISDHGVEWSPLDDVFDVVMMKGTDDEGRETKDRYEVHRDIKTYRQNLRDAFPEEKEAIDQYFELCREAERSMPFLAMKQLLPPFLLPLFRPLLRRKLRLFYRTTLEVLESLTSNERLITLLTYSFGDYGELPSKSAFAMHGILTSHYKGGGYYPVGGSSVIAQAIVPVIEESGGKVLVRAPVSSILVDDDGKAFGVEVKGQHRILAKTVVSTVGAPLTYQKLMPEEHKHRVQRQLDCLKDPKVESECSFLTLFVGVKNDDGEDLGLPNKNLWLYPEGSNDPNWTKYREDIVNNPFPLVFLSFPSVKEPTYHERFPGRHAALAITAAPWDDFAKYADGRVRHRGAEYDKMKSQLSDKLMKHLLEEFPQLKDKIDYVELGTPLSCDYYLGNYRGASYGLAHTPGRFVENDDLTSIRTPVTNLYMSGQDTFCDGILGAMVSGLETSVILKPSLMLKLPFIAFSSSEGEEK